MAKVKKAAALTSVRNVTPGKAMQPTSAKRVLGAPQRTTSAGTRTEGGRRDGRIGKRGAKPGATAKQRTITTKGTAAKKRTRVKKSAARQPAAALLRRSIGKNGAARGAAAAVTPLIKATVRALDPRRKCGEGTSVQLLYRVDLSVNGDAAAHLVFFDRHGWYCEHGRTCPAVAHARKLGGQFARVS